jgi:hypothetical protein
MAITLDGSNLTTSGVINQGTSVDSTSGTSINFLLPIGAKRITVMFNAVSTTGTSGIRIQLGHGVTPTYITTGYIANGAQISSSTPANTTGNDGFITGVAITAAQLNTGSFVITNIVNNVWVYTSIMSTNTTVAGFSSGSLNMTTNVLTALRITTSGGVDTFDNGTINILYE